MVYVVMNSTQCKSRYNVSYFCLFPSLCPESKNGHGMRDLSPKFQFPSLVACGEILTLKESLRSLQVTLLIIKLLQFNAWS